MIYQIVVVDVDGYETYGERKSIGFYSSITEAKNNLPSEEEMSAEYSFGVQRIPLFNGILCITEHGIDDHQFSKLVWSENEHEVKDLFVGFSSEN